MLRKAKLKQGTLSWENARETRIGSSEIFDIVKYYASPEELQNCGINAEHFRAEKPYTTVWALYHKMKNDGFFKRETLAPEYAEYGHAVEPYGVRQLQKGRKHKLKPGTVYAGERLIASLDIEGTAEEIDTEKAFDYGYGHPRQGQKFVCEQKSMIPSVIKHGLPLKYIIQAQYQITYTKADFFILQIMVLKNDTVFDRGKICQMSRQKRYKYLDDNMSVTHLYFQNNEHLARLIEVCIERFFDDVDNGREPKPYLEYDSQQNVIESIRLNSLYNKDMVLDFDLTEYLSAKKLEDAVIKTRKDVQQRIIETAKEYNVCRFQSADGVTAQFASNGSFRVRFPKEDEEV
ncbi:MAG: hypothetical protein II306_07035 [Clostridia bacterium]|nr:hypothetical protein [Clostridia bacterium]